MAYLAHLDGQHSAFLSEVSATLGHSAKVKFDYKYAFNGVAIELSAGEAAQVAALPGVRQVQRELFRYIQTDRCRTMDGRGRHLGRHRHRRPSRHAG